MRVFLTFFLIYSGFAFSLEIKIKNNPNLRSTANFLGQTNIVGSIKAGASAHVIEEKTLPSGNKAYKISLASIKPQTSFECSSAESAAWVYGSALFIDQDPRSETEAKVGMDQCKTCGNRVALATRPIRDIVRQAETVSSSNEISADAQKMIEALKTKGIACDANPEQLRLRGIQCKGRLPSYPEPVRFYIPKDYVKTEKNKVNVFFHGFEAVANIFQINPKDRSGPGDFGGRLAESGNNQTIVVVPESRSVKVPIKVTKMINGVPTEVDSFRVDEKTYRGYFQDGKGDNFERFMGEVSDATKAKFSETSLAGHSGGYLPLNSLLGYPKVANVISSAALFEGTYQQTTNITKWLNDNPGNKMRLSWVQGSEVDAQSHAFIARVQRPVQVKQMIIGKSDNSHMDNIRKGGYADFLKEN